MELPVDLEQDRLLRLVTVVLAGCAGFFGVWTYIDSVSPMPPMEEVGPHGLALLFRIAIASPTAAVAAGLALLAARFCWPVREGGSGGASESA